MSKAYIAFYCGRAGGLVGLVDTLVRLVTGAPWSHCEIALPLPGGQMRCISASGLDGGVRERILRLDPDRWVLVAIPEDAASRALDLLAWNRGAGYDWLGALRFALPGFLRWQYPRRWFCSEFCAAALGYREAWRFSPADLAAIHALASPPPPA